MLKNKPDDGHHQRVLEVALTRVKRKLTNLEVEIGMREKRERVRVRVKTLRHAYQDRKKRRIKLFKREKERKQRKFGKVRRQFAQTRLQTEAEREAKRVKEGEGEGEGKVEKEVPPDGQGDEDGMANGSPDGYASWPLWKKIEFMTEMERQWEEEFMRGRDFGEVFPPEELWEKIREEEERKQQLAEERERQLAEERKQSFAEWQQQQQLEQQQGQQQELEPQEEWEQEEEEEEWGEQEEEEEGEQQHQGKGGKKRRKKPKVRVDILPRTHPLLQDPETSENPVHPSYRTLPTETTHPDDSAAPTDWTDPIESAVPTNSQASTESIAPRDSAADTDSINPAPEPAPKPAPTPAPKQAPEQAPKQAPKQTSKQAPQPAPESAAVEDPFKVLEEAARAPHKYRTKRQRRRRKDFLERQEQQAREIQQTAQTQHNQEAPDHPDADPFKVLETSARVQHEPRGWNDFDEGRRQQGRGTQQTEQTQETQQTRHTQEAPNHPDADPFKVLETLARVQHEPKQWDGLDEAQERSQQAQEAEKTHDGPFQIRRVDPYFRSRPFRVAMIERAKQKNLEKNGDADKGGWDDRVRAKDTRYPLRHIYRPATQHSGSDLDTSTDATDDPFRVLLKKPGLVPQESEVKSHGSTKRWDDGEPAEKTQFAPIRRVSFPPGPDTEPFRMSEMAGRKAGGQSSTNGWDDWPKAEEVQFAPTRTEPRSPDPHPVQSPDQDPFKVVEMSAWVQPEYKAGTSTDDNDGWDDWEVAEETQFAPTRIQAQEAQESQQPAATQDPQDIAPQVTSTTITTTPPPPPLPPLPKGSHRLTLVPQDPNTDLGLFSPARPPPPGTLLILTCSAQAHWSDSVTRFLFTHFPEAYKAYKKHCYTIPSTATNAKGKKPKRALKLLDQHQASLVGTALLLKASAASTAPSNGDNNNKANGDAETGAKSEYFIGCLFVNKHLPSVDAPRWVGSEMRLRMKTRAAMADLMGQVAEHNFKAAAAAAAPENQTGHSGNGNGNRGRVVVVGPETRLARSEISNKFGVEWETMRQVLEETVVIKLPDEMAEDMTLLPGQGRIEVFEELVGDDDQKDKKEITKEKERGRGQRKNKWRRIIIGRGGKETETGGLGPSGEEG